ncbi:MAG: HigA family addiction module antidote protein [Bacteroidetes bacterium]|nr:HigA family addiction module antidote protein [Bacteroidota bacterium]
MAESNTKAYLPDYVVMPGEVLEDHIESIGMTQVELAERTGLAKKTINEIIKGKAAITPETALKLERSLGRPAHFWNNMERQYREDIVRLAEIQRLQSHLAWLKTIPLRAMIKLKWIQECKDKAQQLEEVLRFFGIASPEQWETVWREHQVAYRQTQRFEKSAEAVSAWLRKGEIEAQRIDCAPFDRKQFRAMLDEVRALTTEPPEVFLPRLVELCASAGAAVVFVPELPRTGVYGATRWMGDKAVIQLSLRYKSNDHLWFTFFHEAGHIMLHGRKDVFIEGKGMDGDKETEADDFACDRLIPLADYTDFVATRQPTIEEIKTFASEVGIAPGIVVGRLQHDELLPRNQGNKLKVFYGWDAV